MRPDLLSDLSHLFMLESFEAEPHDLHEADRLADISEELAERAGGEESDGG